MTHYMMELALWILLFFFIGCVVGYVLYRLFGSRDDDAAVNSSAAAVPEPAAPPEPRTAAVVAAADPLPAAEPPAPVPLEVSAQKPTAAPASQTAAAAPPPIPATAARMERPRGLDQPRGGTPDPLQRISGIGPKNEKILHNLGFFHFDQIAAWTSQQIAWVDDHLKFNGRIGREEWVAQAKLLAAGETEEFERRYGKKK